MPTPTVRVARIYEAATSDDGYRLLVDRLWPRGLRRDDARFDEWCKDIAPSTELRSWYGHRPDRFADFTRRYRQELADAEHAGALRHLRELAKAYPTLTLLTASKDVDLSHAAVLAEAIPAARPIGPR
jgi:uncharacterized protein YeaO (DUF488 family)